MTNNPNKGLGKYHVFPDDKIKEFRFEKYVPPKATVPNCSYVWASFDANSAPHDIFCQKLLNFSGY